MDRCVWKSDDRYKDGVVREIRNWRFVVNWSEDVDCGWSDEIETRVVAGGVCKWHGVAGCENRVADDNGDGNNGNGGPGWWIGKQDDDDYNFASIWIK